MSLVALGLGAGLRGSEVLWAQAEDVDLVGSVLVVRVGHPHAREVPVRQQYAAELLSLSRGLEPGEYFHGREPRLTRASTNLTCTLDGVRTSQMPVINARRLRQTWIRDMFDNGVPLADLCRAAGPIDARTLAIAMVSQLKLSPDARYRRLLSETFCDEGTNPSATCDWTSTSSFEEST